MRNGEVSHWFWELGERSRRSPLPGDRAFDVTIVGAGFTGLWTAYYLKQKEPGLRIAVLEREFAGFGASGRNGGWLTNAITGGRHQYVASHGREAAQRFQVAMNETVDEVIAFAETEGIDADIVKGGSLNVAYTEAQRRRLLDVFEAESQWEHTDLELLSGPESIERIAVAYTLAGLWHPHCARVHPAKLVNGLAARVEQLGVAIYEGTSVHEIRSGVVLTDRGKVESDVIVRATEGFTAGLKGLRRRWLPMNSSMIVTEPLPAAFWDEIGWAGYDTLGDSAHVYMYAQRTADDRIALGGRGIPYRYGSRTDTNGVTQEATARSLQEILRRLFPQTARTGIEHVWSGVLGVPRDWSATVGLDRTTGLAWAGGYVGTGVTSTNLAGRTLADLITGADSELTSLPWVDHRVRSWEPEPLRWIATRGLYAAYSFADRSEARGRARTSPIARVADVVSGRRKK